MRHHDLFLDCLVSALSLAAAAQQAAGPVTPPAHQCEKPVGGPGIDPTFEQQKRFQKKVDTYKECINKYVGEKKALADEHFEIAKKYQEAGNAAIGEYNAYVTDLNAQYGNKDKDSKGLSTQPSAPPPSKKY